MSPVDPENPAPVLTPSDDATPPRLAFRLPLDPARLLRARHRIRDYLHAHSVEPAAVDDVVLAIQEAMSNAVRHSGTTDDLEVGLSFRGTDLVVAIRDYGRGLDVASLDYSSCPDRDAPSGRGLYLISRLMDEMTLVSGRGLEVRAVKRNVLASERVAPALLAARAHQDTRRLALLDEVDEGFFTLDWEYRYSMANAAYQQLVGHDLRALLGRMVWEVFPRLRDHEAGQALRDAMELGRPVLLEYISPTFGRWYELRAYPASTGVSAYSRDIDERKRGELERDELLGALRQSREDMDRAQAVGEIGSWRLDVRRKVLTWSRETSRIFGVPQATALSYEVFLAAVHSEDREAVDAHWQAALAGEPYDVEHRILVDGEVRWVREKAFLEYDESGEPIGGIGITQDITARKRSEEALQRTRDRFELAVRAAGAGTWDWELASGQIEWSPKLYELFGVDPSRRTASLAAWSEVLHPEDCDLATARIQRALDDHTELDSQYRIVRNGEVRWINALGEGSYDEGGEPTRMTGLCIDVTERELAEQALRRSERLYRELVDNANSAILRWTRDGTLTFLNEYAERLFGWSAEEAIGKHVGILLPSRASTGADLTELARDIVDHPALYRNNINENICRDGRRLWMTWTNRAIHDEEGQVAEILAIGSDITELRRTSAALYESEQHFVSLFESMIEGVALHELVYEEGRAVDYRILEVNPSFERQTGMSRELARGRLASAVYGTGSAPYLDEYASVADSRSPYSFETYFAPLERQFRITAVSPAPGRFATIFEDITERKSTEAALRESQERGRRNLETTTVLLRAANALASRPSLDAVLDTLVDLVLEALDHSRATVSLWDEAASQLTVAASKGSPRMDVGLRLSIDRLSEPARRVVFTGTHQFIDYDALPEGRKGVGDSLPSHLGLGVPLLYRDRFVGLLVVDDPAERRPFSELEIELVSGIAAEAAVAIENARLYEAQRRVATTLQEHLVHSLPTIPGLELAALSLPAYKPELVGGDFHDVFEVPDGRVVALIGDVMGKGVKAAGLTETVRSAVRALALLAPSPVVILQHVNRLLLMQEYEQFVSVLVVVLDPVTGKGSLASAGHPPPVLLRDGTATLIEPTYGPVLGTFESIYSATEFVLPPGAALVLYTDGLTEARSNGKLFGEDRLVEAFAAVRDASPQVLIEHLRDAVLRYAGELKDDLEIVALRRAEEASERRSPSRP